MASRTPWASAAREGVPAAAASMIDMPQPSWLAAWTRNQARPSRSALVASSTRPRISTPGTWSARCRSEASSGPSPADHQAAPHLGTGQAPGVEQQLDPLVGDEAGQREEERLGCPRPPAGQPAGRPPTRSPGSRWGRRRWRPGRRRWTGRRRRRGRWRYTAGMKWPSTARPTAAAGAGKRVRHCSRWTWCTRHTDGRRRQSGVKYGKPFSTSITTSASPKRVRQSNGARRYWLKVPPASITGYWCTPTGPPQMRATSWPRPPAR